MNLRLTVDTDVNSGIVILMVDGKQLHKSEYFSDPKYIDFLGTRHAIDFLRDVHTVNAEKAVGKSPLSLLKELRDAIFREHGTRLPKGMEDLMHRVTRLIHESERVV